MPGLLLAVPEVPGPVPVTSGFRFRHKSLIWPVYAALLIGLHAGSYPAAQVMRRSRTRPRPSSEPRTMITGFSHWPRTAKPGELRLSYCTLSAAACPGP